MLKPIKIALGVAVSAFLLAGCTFIPTAGVEPGDGPAATKAPASASSPPSAPVSPEVTEPTSREETPTTATFKDKYTYADGVQVEVTKIRHKKVTKQQAEWGQGEKAGDSYVVMTFRIKNGSKQRIEAFGYATAYYGPDGDEAEKVYYDYQGGPEGVVLPGKAKSGVHAFLIPEEYQDDVVVEFSATMEHDPAVFAGSV